MRIPEKIHPAMELSLEHVEPTLAHEFAILWVARELGIFERF